MADGDAPPKPASDDPASATDDAGLVAAAVYGGDGYKTISRYRDILASRGVDWGLLGPRERDRLWQRHILNSAAVAELVPPGAAIADVGSGAGLPGIPVAVLRDDLGVDLIEPLLRRSRFLVQTVEEIGLTDRVRVIRSRAEEVAQRYDAVLSRALAPLDRLIRWCLPLMRPDGQILAIKGVSAAEEVRRHTRLITASRLVAEILTPQIDPRVEATTVIRLRVPSSRDRVRTSVASER